MNALSAIATSIGAAVQLKDIKSGLEALEAVPGRMQQNIGINDSCIINDTYNANPNSLCAALNVISTLEGTKVLVLGDMGELGEDVVKLHAQSGEMAAQLKVDRLFTLGDFSKHAAKAFGSDAKHYEDVDALIKDVRGLLSSETTVLVKGSRMMRMERVVNALVKA